MRRPGFSLVCASAAKRGGMHPAEYRRRRELSILKWKMARRVWFGSLPLTATRTQALCRAWNLSANDASDVYDEMFPELRNSVWSAVA